MFIELKENQTGYNVVGEYIRRFWKENNNYQGTVVCSISFLDENPSSDNLFEDIVEIAMPKDYGNNIEFLYDWWEGQKTFSLNGIKYVDDIMFRPEEGIYDE